MTSNAKVPFPEQSLLPEIKNAVIACNNALTPAFHYIIGMREANEHLKKSKNYAPKRALNPLKRTQSFCALTITGHLFDTLAINRILDTLGENAIKFNMVDVKIGNSEDQESQVVLQIFAKNHHAIDAAILDITPILEKYDIHMQTAAVN